MEIQKIFSEIDTDEKLYSVLLSEDELALFSEIQKEFNSKAQKLLRRASDYKKAMTGTGRLVSGESSQINRGVNALGYNGEDVISQGRKLNQRIGGFGGVNQSINWKAQAKELTTGSNAIKAPELIGKRGLKSYKKNTLADQKKVMKNYDHGKGDTSKRINAAKELMMLNR